MESYRVKQDAKGSKRVANKSQMVTRFFYKEPESPMG